MLHFRVISTGYGLAVAPASQTGSAPLAKTASHIIITNKQWRPSMSLFVSLFMDGGMGARMYKMLQMAAIMLISLSNRISNLAPRSNNFIEAKVSLANGS